ncbi:MAG: class I SAM-dependent methyltransferase [Acidobacteria bacterium]|nr:class I SAM-dependent methyltransferase [Acidobacteriota bacterium]
MIEFISEVRDSAFPDEWYEMGESSHFWVHWRFAAARRMVERIGLRRTEPLRVLDVGGGAGVLRGQLEEATRWTVDLTDVNQTALESAKAGRGRTLYYDVLQEEPELVGRYDVVCLFDVIEHVEHPRELLAASLRHLRPRGHLLLNVPALQWLFSAYDRAQGHVRRYDRASLVAEVGPLPCDVLDVRYWGMSLVPLLALRRLVVGENPGPGTLKRGFTPPGVLANGVLHALMATETTLLSRPPLGTSALLAARLRGAAE